MIYVDADACPVKDEVVTVAARYGVGVIMVSNGGIRPRREAFVETVVVPAGPDEADRWIAERIGSADVCVTADIPLAARCLEAGAAALKPDGEALTPTNIGAKMAMRDLMADLRAADPFATGGGGRTFGRADRSRFLQSLDRMVRQAAATGAAR